MKFVRFLENHFQELRLKEGMVAFDSYDVGLDAEIKATHGILSSFRTACKWVMLPKILFYYLLVQLRLKKEPRPVLMEKMKEQKEAEKLAKEVADNMKKDQAETESDVVH